MEEFSLFTHSIPSFVYFRHKVNRLIIIIFALLLHLQAFSQQTEEQLATQYFSNAEYDKAADLYENLLSKNATSVYFYENLLQSYLYLKKYEQAEKLVKKQQKRFPENNFFKVDPGYVYRKSGNNLKAENFFSDLLKSFKGTEKQTTDYANALQKRGEDDLAIEVYKKARVLNRNQTIYAIELAQLYAKKRNTRMVIDEYLIALEANPEYLEEIEDYFQLYLDDKADYELLKSAVLKKEKENASNDLYGNLLIWIFVQKKDFDNAFIQAKALDKRNKENGARVYELAKLAMSNKEYDATINIYHYIMQMGKDKPYYLAAQIGILEAKHDKITLARNYSQTDLLTLETEYNVFLNQEGRNDFTASAMLALANLEAYYLHDFDKGIGLYKELIEMPRLNARFKANCKLELGDIYVLKNEVWEAVLLYGQVDKDFLEEPIGQEAKFRNARLSYYIGEFEWAKAQLDVLKTATSQLIANDALELSLLIQDNTLDSIEEPLLLFAKADLFYYQNKTTESMALLDSLQTVYPRHSLADDILFKRAQIYNKDREYQKCIAILEQIGKEHGTEILGDNALFMMADIVENNLLDKQKAMQLYEKFMEQYPGSFYMTEVRRRFRNLRGDVLN